MSGFIVSSPGDQSHYLNKKEGVTSSSSSMAKITLIIPVAVRTEGPSIQMTISSGSKLRDALDVFLVTDHSSL